MGNYLLVLINEIVNGRSKIFSFFFVFIFNILSESVARIGNKKVKFEFPKSLEKPEDLVNHFLLAKFDQS